MIEQGQSPYHILTNHPELDMSVRTKYSYLDQGLFLPTDFTATFAAWKLSSYVEMDTVHSSRESKKTLLTLFFTKEKLFLAFL